MIANDPNAIVPLQETSKRFLGFPINEGITGTNAFYNSPYANANFTDYMDNYTTMMEQGVPISNDEQMFVDNEIANRRFP